MHGDSFAGPVWGINERDAGMTKPLPQIIEADSQRLDELLHRADSNTLRAEDTQLLRQILESYLGFFQIVGDKNTTIARLRKLLFGATSEKAKHVLGAAEPDVADTDTTNDAPSSSSEVVLPGASSDSARIGEEDSAEPASGHGRRAAEDYSGAEVRQIPHPTLTAGDACPDCGRGTLYDKSPGVLVRVVGQAPLRATVYHLQKLRCHVCGKLFSAAPPAGAGDGKYDPTAVSMIGLLKYGSGLPFYRLERLQGNCAIPLPVSTQWDLVQAGALLLAPAHEELIRQAAQGEVVYNDDTTVKILELMGARARERPPDDHDDPNRTGLFTSGVVATRAGVRMALFFSGRRHAGENLSEVLRHRVATLDAPVQMCDGLARNLPREFETILANCLAHGRRNFVDLVDRFPAECRHVIEAFRVVYRHDKVAREQGLSAEARLAYHQAHSQATMEALKAWCARQFDEQRVEPNSALGAAIHYLLKRWEPLTLFLRHAGAPLDNNLCERALKKAILHRKNALFYKTRNGAAVGDVYMSLIYTCELNGANAFEYLYRLQLHASDVARQPERWLPWNYRHNFTPAADAA